MLVTPATTKPGGLLLLIRKQVYLLTAEVDAEEEASTVNKTIILTA